MGAEIEPTGSGGMDVELLAAALRQDTADLDVYAKVLSVNLVESLPQGAVQVERKRSMADRVAGREGSVTSLDVSLGETRLGLRIDRGRPIGEICKEVRGVVLSRQPVGVQQWVEKLAQTLVVFSQQNANAAEALRKLVAGS